MLTKVSPLTLKGRAALPEFRTGVAATPPRAPVKGWRFWRRMGVADRGRARAERMKAVRMVVFILDDKGWIGFVIEFWLNWMDKNMDEELKRVTRLSERKECVKESGE